MVVKKALVLLSFSGILLSSNLVPETATQLQIHQSHEEVRPILEFERMNNTKLDQAIADVFLAGEFDEYGYYYLDHGNSTGNIHFIVALSKTDIKTEDLKERISSTLGNSVEFLQVKYSKTDLDKIQDTVSFILNENKVKNITISQDLETNKIRVRGEIDEKVRQQLLSISSDMDIQFEESKPDQSQGPFILKQ